MQIDIWNVEHGGCSVVTAPNGRRLMIDCGHSVDRNWYPSKQYYRESIEELVISNYDEDHVSDLVGIMNDTSLAFIMRNPSLSSSDLAQIKKENGMGPGISRLQSWMARAECQPLSGSNPDWGGLSVIYYYNQYPSDFTDENNLSVVTFIEWSGFSIVFPGDLEQAGWSTLLLNWGFREKLRSVNVFVASHHGRENGCCADVFSYCSPQIIVMSDSNKQFSTQETNSWYSARTNGMQYNGRTRKVFTTRNDGDIHISVGTSTWGIQTQYS